MVQIAWRRARRSRSKMIWTSTLHAKAGTCQLLAAHNRSRHLSLRGWEPYSFCCRNTDEVVLSKLSLPRPPVTSQIPFVRCDKVEACGRYSGQYWFSCELVLAQYHGRPSRYLKSQGSSKSGSSSPRSSNPVAARRKVVAFISHQRKRTSERLRPSLSTN